MLRRINEKLGTDLGAVEVPPMTAREAYAMKEACFFNDTQYENQCSHVAQFWERVQREQPRIRLTDKRKSLFPCKKTVLKACVQLLCSSTHCPCCSTLLPCLSRLLLCLSTLRLKSLTLACTTCCIDHLRSVAIGLASAHRQFFARAVLVCRLNDDGRRMSAGQFQLLTLDGDEACLVKDVGQVIEDLLKQFRKIGPNVFNICTQADSAAPTQEQPEPLNRVRIIITPDGTAAGRWREHDGMILVTVRMVLPHLEAFEGMCLQQSCLNVAVGAIRGVSCNYTSTCATAASMCK